MAASSKLTKSFPMTRIFYKSQVAFDHKRFLKMTVNSKFITIRIVTELLDQMLLRQNFTKRSCNLIVSFLVKSFMFNTVFLLKHFSMLRLFKI